MTPAVSSALRHAATVLAIAWCGCGLRTIAAEPGEDPGGLIVSSRRIWDQAPHSAFTDLLHHAGEWFCVFREGQGHVSPDGRVRVLTSRDGDRWETRAVIRSDRGDLRDPKIVATPDGRLMLTAAVALPEGAPARHQTLAWLSRDGRDWGEPSAIGEPNVWLWRVTWHEGNAYGAGYGTAADRFVRLYRSADGTRFETLVPELHREGYPNETSIVFRPDGTAVCLLRRDGEPSSGLIGTARHPYTDWTWKDLGVRIGGPHLLRLEDGRWIACVRLYDGGPRTSLAWVEPETGAFREWARLPSGGDTSYAGLQWHDDLLWVSYYSSHEGRTAIYLARVRLPGD